MNGPGRQYQHRIWQRDELQPVINEDKLSPGSRRLFDPQTWAERCIPASPRRRKWRTPAQTAPCRLWICDRSRSSWDTGPGRLTFSCLRSSCRRRTCSYETPGTPESTFHVCICFYKFRESIRGNHKVVVLPFLCQRQWRSGSPPGRARRTSVHCQRTRGPSAWPSRSSPCCTATEASDGRRTLEEPCRRH